MRTTLLLFLSISLFLTGCASSNDVVAQDLWVKSSEMSTRGGMTAVYGTLTNDSSQDVVLVGGATDIAGVVEVHEMSMIGGEMMMQEIDGGLVIPAGKSIVLEPGGNHLMLMMLTDDLQAGEEISVTFDFDGAEDLTIDGIVAKPAEGGDEEYHSDMEMDN
jgi:copper(I)-binding protein